MRGEGEYRDFAASIAPLLHRVAYLLTCDVEAAAALTNHTLRRLRRRWRDVTDGEPPEVIALNLLVRAATRVTPRSQDLERGAVPDQRAAERDAAWAQLRALPPSERIAQVLDHLPASVALPFDVGGATVGVDLVTETLEERIELLRPINFDIEALSRIERKRTARVFGVAAMVFVLVAVSSGLQLAKPASHVAAREDVPTVSPEAERPTVPPPVPWPTRGNLSQNAEALAEMKVAFAAQHRSLIGGVQVLYAADLPTGRLGLVAGTKQGDGDLYMWCFIPANPALPTAWWPESIPSFGGAPDASRRLLRFAVGLPSGDTMILLGPQDLKTAKVSWRPSYPPDGRVVREYEPLPLLDGAAMVTLGTRPWFLVRVGASHPLDHYDPTGLQPSGQLRLAWLEWPADDTRLNATYGKADRDTVRGALSQIAGLLGLTDAAPLTPRVIWGGEVRGAPAALVHATLRSGGEFRAVNVGGVTNVWVVPRGAPDFPAAWTAEAGPTSSTVAVLAGADIARVEFWSKDKLVLSGEARPLAVRRFEVPMQWGEGEVPDTTIVLRDSKGEVRWTRAVIDLPGPSVTD